MNDVQSNFKINIPMVIYLFCFLFAPPILPINFIFILSIYSLVMLFRFYNGKIIPILRKSAIKSFTILMMLYLAYVVLIMLMNFTWGERIYASNYITELYKIFLITPIMMICVVYVIARAEQLNFSIEQLIIHFILAGAIEASISLITYISPEVRQFCIEIMNKSQGSGYSDYILSMRVYGFANGLYDLFGWGTGIIAVLPLFLSKEQRKKYIWFIPLLLLAPLLNARTGLVMFLGGVIIYVLFLENDGAISILKKVVQMLLCVVAAYLVLMWLKSGNSTIYKWVVNGMEAFFVTLTNSQNGSNAGLTTLFKESFWTLPSFPDIIFGTGHSVYVGKEFTQYAHSDVGYVNYLWIGGIVGSLILYSIFFYMFYMAVKKSEDKITKWVLIFLGATIIVFNVKAQAFTHCPATTIILTILFYVIYVNAGKRESNEIYSDNTSL